MSVVNILAEIAKEDYVGLSDVEIADRLNEWSTTYIPCFPSTLRIKFAELLLTARLELANSKNLVDSKVFERWELLLKYSENDKNEPVYFNAAPVFIENLFQTFAELEIISATELIWLLDLGRIQTNISRKIFNKDISEQDLIAAKERIVLAEKIEARRVEISNLQADLQTAYNELQKRDVDGSIIGDKDFIPEWEKK